MRTGFSVLFAGFLVLTACIDEVNASPAHFRANPPTALKGQSVFAIDTEFYQTTFNFSQNEEVLKKISGKYQYLKFTPELQYNFGDGHQLFSSFDFVSSQAVDSSFTRANTNFSELALGFRVFFLSLGLQWIPEINLVAPLYAIESDMDDSLIGEGATSVEPGLWIAKSFYRWKFHLRTSYEWRSDGRAQLVHYGIGTSYRSKSQIRFNGGIGGFDSITEDVYTDTRSERNSVTSNANASSFKFYSINPKTLFINAGIEFPITSRQFIQLSYKGDLTGIAYAAGDSIMAKWIMNLAPSLEDSTQPSNSKFELDYEGIEN